jgi:hypothetical protein
VLERLRQAAWARRAAKGIFERVDSAGLGARDFRVSDSIDVDGAPLLAFPDTVPAYLSFLDRPRASRRAALADDLAAPTR